MSKKAVPRKKSLAGKAAKAPARRVLIKIGGAALEDAKRVSKVCAEVARLRKSGVEVILVHGGGSSINRELERKGITWSFHEGQRITTPEMMETIEGTLGGSVNGALVRALEKAGAPAAGMTGVDGGMLRCVVSDKRLGLVGKVTEVNASLIEAALKAGFVPVIAPIGVGTRGEAYNINADWAAASLASALNVQGLYFMTDQKGVLGADMKLLRKLTPADFDRLIAEGVIKGGMLAKARAVLHALFTGVPEVRVLHAANAPAFLSKKPGTQCAFGPGAVVSRRSGAVVNVGVRRYRRPVLRIRPEVSSHV